MVSTGTDDDPDWKDPDSDLDVEIIRLVRDAGFSPMEALKSATFVGARAAGQQDHVGRIEPGYLADFVVFNENPLDKIENIRSVNLVVKHGIAYSREKYKPFHPNVP
jgi:imidazolonepropionase-like amidohydrolase